MKRLLLLLLSVWATNVFSAEITSFDTTGIALVEGSINKQKLRLVSGVFAGGYALGITGLYSLWYRDYAGSNFHLFNDNLEWLQMDKAGHALSTFQLSRIGTESFAWTGMPLKKAALWGTGSAMAVMISVETLDGFSDHWGFSAGDVIANTVGASSFLVQEWAWHETRIKYCYSFHKTSYAKLRPDVLGSNTIEQMLKDYNGQTIWLSGNVRSFVPSLKRIPRWLNLAIGYGAEGMVGGHDNIFQNKANQIVDYSLKYPRSRQYYVSFDIDLTKLKTRNAILKSLFGNLGMIKLPAPTIEFSESGKAHFHPFYF